MTRTIAAKCRMESSNARTSFLPSPRLNRRNEKSVHGCLERSKTQETALAVRPDPVPVFNRGSRDLFSTYNANGYREAAASVEPRGALRRGVIVRQDAPKAQPGSEPH